MRKQDATNIGVDPATAWRYFRVDNGKASMSPPPQSAAWFKLVSVPLGNGDEVGVATGWSWPDAFDGVTVNDLRAAQKEVSQGGPWRASHQAKMWVGKPISKALKLNIKNKADRHKIRTVLAKWIETGMFVEVEGLGEDRHTTQFIEVGTWAND
jgi:hypothetical protein